MKRMIVLLMVLSCFNTLYALPSGAPICEVFADFSNITGMTDRGRIPNSGDYNLSANVSEYNAFEHVEITIDGASFRGLMFTVVDKLGNRVGSFSPDSQVGNCQGGAMSVTHTTPLGLDTKTLFWIPPTEPVGTVYVLGYVYDGESRNFHRFVRDDDSALEITQSDVIFLNSFE